MKKLITSAIAAITVMALGLSAQAATKYKIGDIYDVDGLKGVVVAVDASGEHGTIMTIEHSSEKWCSDKDQKFDTNLFYEDDGQKNMKLLASYIEESGSSWADYPLFNWARSLGEGWYIPAKDEVLQVWKNINGGSETYSKKAFKAFGKILKKSKGDGLIDNRPYIGTKQPWWWLTSTEGDGGQVYVVQFGNDFKSQITVGFHSTFKAFLIKKTYSQAVRSRAFHKF